jgi:hypothetical protein
MIYGAKTVQTFVRYQYILPRNVFRRYARCYPDRFVRNVCRATGEKIALILAIQQSVEMENVIWKVAFAQSVKMVVGEQIVKRCVLQKTVRIAHAIQDVVWNVRQVCMARTAANPATLLTVPTRIVICGQANVTLVFKATGV